MHLLPLRQSYIFLAQLSIQESHLRTLLRSRSESAVQSSARHERLVLLLFTLDILGDNGHERSVRG